MAKQVATGRPRGDGAHVGDPGSEAASEAPVGRGVKVKDPPARSDGAAPDLMAELSAPVVTASPKPKPREGRARVQIDEQCLAIRDLEVAGPAFEAARECVARGEEVEAVVREMLNLGGQMLLHGANQATVDSVSAEVNRLIDAVAVAAAEELPKSFEAQVEHLGTVLDEHFDGRRKDSIQQQLVEAFELASDGQQRSLINTLLDDKGPLGLLKAELAGKLQLAVSQQTELLTRITAVSEQVTSAAQLKAERERGTAKGFTYEEQVVDAVERAFAPFEDVVEPTGLELGSDKNKCGDCVVSLNPKDTGGEIARVVVEAKDRKLSVRQTLDELARAMSNREATVGIIAFARTDEAPMRTSPLRLYPANRLVAVFDPDEDGPLALEVACEFARGLALSKLDHEHPELDAEGIAKDLEHLTTVLEDARCIKRGLNAAHKGLDTADTGYEQLRQEAFTVVADLRKKLNGTSTEEG